MAIKKKQIGISSIIIAIASVIITFLTYQDGLTKAYVERIIDGDTIKVKIANKSYNVRIIGVNTPETNHPTKGVESYGLEAKEFTKKKLTGKTVWLEFDTQQKDKYGRLLAYVWLEKPNAIDEDKIRTKMFNAILLLEGYAQVMTVQPNIKYADYFVKFQKEAFQEKRGLWGDVKTTKTNSLLETDPKTKEQSEQFEKLEEFLVFISKSGDKYHLKDCRYVTSEYVSISVEEAKAKKLKPCSVCNPDKEYEKFKSEN